jgi:hypothetical protein
MIRWSVRGASESEAGGYMPIAIRAEKETAALTRVGDLAYIALVLACSLMSGRKSVSAQFNK